MNKTNKTKTLLNYIALFSGLCHQQSTKCEWLARLSTGSDKGKSETRHVNLSFKLVVTT